MRFSVLAPIAALAGTAAASITTIYQTAGTCHTERFTTLPLTVAAATTTVTTTLPLTTTVSRYPGFKREEISRFAHPPAPTTSRELQTIVYIDVCQGPTITDVHSYYTDVTTPGTTTMTATEYIATSTYTLCIPGHVCYG